MSDDLKAEARELLATFVERKGNQREADELRAGRHYYFSKDHPVGEAMIAALAQGERRGPLHLAMKKALFEFHEFVSLFTTGNSVRREVRAIAVQSGTYIADEATRLRDEVIMPAKAELFAHGDVEPLPKKSRK